LVTVAVRYFAKLKEEADVSTELLETSARTVRELWAELEMRHRFTLGADLVLVAQADEFCGWDAELISGREVAFMPPVSGG
jgi:molybdopterin converting factor small subunit